MSMWLQDTLAWMRTLPRHEPQDAADVGGYEDPPRSKVVFHKVQAPARAPGGPDRPAVRTPLHVVRRMVAQKKAEMAAERRGKAVRNRILSDFSADAAHAAQAIPRPYDVALGRELNPDVKPHLYDALLSITDTGVGEVPAPPCPYDEPIQRMREWDRMRDANR